MSTRSRRFSPVNVSIAVSRRLVLRAAACAALPLMSEPDDAAVGDAFGTLLVSDAVMRMRSMLTASSSATTCATLMNRPCPISVPP
jgi:hypothetical protein